MNFRNIYEGKTGGVQPYLLFHFIKLYTFASVERILFFVPPFLVSCRLLSTCKHLIKRNEHFF